MKPKLFQLLFLQSQLVYSHIIVIAIFFCIGTRYHYSMVSFVGQNIQIIWTSIGLSVVIATSSLGTAYLMKKSTQDLESGTLETNHFPRESPISDSNSNSNSNTFNNTTQFFLTEYHRYKSNHSKKDN